jgi:hypothetical protein
MTTAFFIVEVVVNTKITSHVRCSTPPLFVVADWLKNKERFPFCPKFGGVFWSS